MSSTAGERLGELRPICRCCFYARFPRIAGESAPAPGVPCHYPCRARLRDFQTPTHVGTQRLGRGARQCVALARSSPAKR
jgi:ligand-binding sensor protein